jgi:O-antigen ligase
MIFVSLAKKPSRILVAGAMLSFISAGLLLSGSVGSILAASVAAAVWFGAHRTRASRLVAVGAVAVVAATVYTTQVSRETPSSIERITHLGSGSPDDPNRTFNDRRKTYRVAITRIEENPVVGIGLSRETTDAAQWVHNIFIGSWYTTGVLGLVGMILIFAAAARAAWSSIISARSAEEQALSLALACSFVAFLVFLMSEPALFIRYGWVSVALVFSMRAIQANALQVRAPYSGVTAPQLTTVAVPASEGRL